MSERFAVPYNDFVLPFMIGMVFVLIFLFIGLVKIIKDLPGRDRKKFFLLFVNPKRLALSIKDIFADCLFHVKIFKKNFLLGYMHMSIALGWFMLIVIGHIEVWLYTPQRLSLFYYPIFFRYFVAETSYTLRGSFFFFLMDFFLLMVLSGVALAMFKRVRSKMLGMRRTTKASLPDLIAMYSLWAIFPLRLLAESFTAGISGGSFLTKPMFWIFSNFLSKDYHIVPTWWAYSIALGAFLVALPFSRYMHIPTEIILILMRNAGIKVSSHRKGYAETQIYSCSSCGICIDACPMGIHRKNLKYSSVYYMRFVRRRNKIKSGAIADKCLMCGKCVAACPVGVESCDLKRAFRATVPYKIEQNYNYTEEINIPKIKGKVLYYAGCMTHLTPSIKSSISGILDKAGIEWSFMDQDGGLCCGRPLKLAGKTESAQKLIDENKRLIKESGANTLLLSCPICYKVFKEEYGLGAINVIHHSVFLLNLLKEKRISLEKNDFKYVFHDPCELGRGSGIYEEPRQIIGCMGNLVDAEVQKSESICCGGSIGSITLSYEDRKHITDSSLRALNYNHPDVILTACPLCRKTFSSQSATRIADISEIVNEQIKQ